MTNKGTFANDQQLEVTMPNEDDIGFQNLLISVLSNQKPHTELLNHPTFQQRIRRICRYLDRSDNSDELVADTYVKLLQSNAWLDQAGPKNENQFFNWCFQVAKNQLRDRSRKTYCNEKTKRWPDDIAHLSPDKLDEFFEHADVCPYHNEILAAETAELDKEFCSTINVVRGLDPYGRIDDWERLTATAANLKRNWASWQEAALKEEFPFDFIGLYNAGRRIVTASKIVNLNAQPTIYQLDPQAGLQIRGVTSKDPDDDVLLGFYPLAGLRHQNVEQRLPLANGYAVELLVNQHSETHFAVGFRCVKTEVMNEERAAESNGYEGDEVVAVADANVSTIVPAFMAAMFSRAQFQPTRHIVGLVGIAIVWGLLIPFFSSRSVDNIAPVVLPSTAHGHPQHSTQPPSNKSSAPDKSIAQPSLPLPYRAFLVKNLGKKSSPSSPTKPMNARGTQVEWEKTWLIFLYETRRKEPETAVVTHHVRNEKLKNELEWFVPDASLKPEPATVPTKTSERPQARIEVEWKTFYSKNRLVIVEATVNRRDTPELSNSIIKEACSVERCDDEALIATAVQNVYEIINPSWKPPSTLSRNKLNACGCGSCEPLTIPGNTFGTTGVSRPEFDDLENCQQSSDESSSTQ